MCGCQPMCRISQKSSRCISYLSPKSVNNFTVDANSATVGTAGIKSLRAGLSVIQISSVLQSIDERVYTIPKFVANGRTQVLDDEGIPRFQISAAAATFRNGQSYFTHAFSLPSVFIFYPLLTAVQSKIPDQNGVPENPERHRGRLHDSTVLLPIPAFGQVFLQGCTRQYGS